MNSAGTSTVVGDGGGSVRFFWLHPFCFALFPLLSLYASNVEVVAYTDVTRPLVVILAGSLAVCLIAFLCVRNVARTALIATLAFFLFFSYGHVVDFAVLDGWSPRANGIVSLHGPLFAVYTALLVAGLYLIKRLPDARLAPINSFLNVVGVVLIALPSITIANAAIHNHGLTGPTPTHTSPQDPILTAVARAKPDKYPPTPADPDIYYIILDAYGREDVLKYFYDFDNRPFLDALRQRGFYIADHARPNYGQTVESISSSLNMTYLDQVAEKVGKGSIYYAPLCEMIDQNAVRAALKPLGYRFVAINTGFSLTLPTTADLLLAPLALASPSELSGFEVLTLNMTPFAVLQKKESTLYDRHRNELLAGFQGLAELPRLPYRKFAFVHILAPHPPFVLGPDAGPFQDDRAFSLADGSDYMRRGTRTAYHSNYIAQLQGVNKLVLKAVDSIFAESTVRPIILIQGDHGPRMFVDWKSLKGTDIRETYGNLSAFELPDGKAPEVFYDSISPVNSFRLLLDHQFNAKLPRVPDRNYYSTLDRPYDFDDITDRLSPHLLTQ